MFKSIQYIKYLKRENNLHYDLFKIVAKNLILFMQDYQKKYNLSIAEQISWYKEHTPGFEKYLPEIEKYLNLI